MIRSPPAAENKKTKGGFRLEPAILKLGASDTPMTKELPQNNTGPADLAAGDADLDLEVSASDLLGNTATSVDDDGLETDQPETTEDPFDRLTRMMTANFAAMKNDNVALSGQLGLLQNNVLDMSETVDNLKSEVGGMNKRLTNVTAQAVTNKCGITSLNKKLSEMQETNAREIGRQVSVAIATEMKKMDLSARLPTDITERMDKMGKELDRFRAVHTTHEMAAPANRSRPLRFRSSGPALGTADDEARQYWAARKKIRCAPIPQGNDRNEFLSNADDFFTTKLAIPSGELHQTAVIDVQRVPGRKKNNNPHEAIITFDTVQTRDCVASYASNLANHEGVQRPSLRLEIPDYLCGVFRVLERYAHFLKSKNPIFFRRSIKYDYVNLTLVLDYCTAQGGEWRRATYEEAAVQIRGKPRNTSSRSSSIPDAPDAPRPSTQSESDAEEDMSQNQD